MKLHATRLTEGEDLKESITQFVVSRGLSSAVIVSAVGSLSKAQIRMAGAKPGQQDIRQYEGTFEIISLIGTIDFRGSAHLHIAFSDDEGVMTGGHLKEGCIVHTTVELVVASDSELLFTRIHDKTTGFDELSVTHPK